VFVITNGKARRKDVTLGPRNDGDVQVQSGLAIGDQVAVSSVSSLLDGMEVAP
jgi:multidrug efflux pump subunit AcrA (membrane-fusion protein)